MAWMVDGFTKKGERRARIDEQRTRQLQRPKGEWTAMAIWRLMPMEPFPPYPTRTLSGFSGLVAWEPARTLQLADILCIGRGARPWHRPALTGHQTTLEGICWWWFVSPPHIDHLGVRGHGPMWDDNDVLLHKHFNSSILTRPISELSTSHPAVDIEHGQPRRLRLQHMSQCWRPDAMRTATCPNLI